MHQDFLPPGIVILTGAGISKESGIDTVRDQDGLWTRVNLEEVATIEAWHRDKKKVLDFYNDTRRSFRAAHIEPKIPQSSTEPQRLWLLFMVAGMLLAAWSVLVLIYYSIRDRAWRRRRGGAGRRRNHGAGRSGPGRRGYGAA